IYRIFEGTNEINRLLVVDMLLKRAMKGDLNFMEAIKTVNKEIFSATSANIGENAKDTFAAEKKYITNFKKAILLLLGAIAQKFKNDLRHEQEIIMNVTDMLINTFCAESALLRVIKLTDTYGKAAADLQADMMRTYLHDAADKIHKCGKDALN